MGNLMENVHLEDQEIGWRIMLRLILRMKVVGMGDGWNLPRIVFNGGDETSASDANIIYLQNFNLCRSAIYRHCFNERFPFNQLAYETTNIPQLNSGGREFLTRNRATEPVQCNSHHHKQFRLDPLQYYTPHIFRDLPCGHFQGSFSIKLPTYILFSYVCYMLIQMHSQFQLTQ